MDKQLSLDVDKLTDYNVYINGRLRARVGSEEAAWSIIGHATFGSTYMVTDSEGQVRAEFVPL